MALAYSESCARPNADGNGADTAALNPDNALDVALVLYEFGRLEFSKDWKVTDVNNPPRLLIIDARNYSAAQLNRLRGGGFEYVEYYEQSQIRFMDLPNLHSVRLSFERLTQLYESKPEANWYSALEKTLWLYYISQLIKSASEVAAALDAHCRPVMVHCTDGWDRTPQLTSLAKILLDPFYRTIKIKLAMHTYSGLFGTFLFNSERDRHAAQCSQQTCSLWAFLNPTHNWSLRNYLYEPKQEPLEVTPLATASSGPPTGGRPAVQFGSSVNALLEEPALSNELPRSQSLTALSANSQKVQPPVASLDNQANLLTGYLVSTTSTSSDDKGKFRKIDFNDIPDDAQHHHPDTQTGILHASLVEPLPVNNFLPAHLSSSRGNMSSPVIAGGIRTYLSDQDLSSQKCSHNRSASDPPSAHRKIRLSSFVGEDLLLVDSLPVSVADQNQTLQPAEVADEPEWRAKSPLSETSIWPDSSSMSSDSVASQRSVKPVNTLVGSSSVGASELTLVTGKKPTLRLTDNRSSAEVTPLCFVWPSDLDGLPMRVDSVTLRLHEKHYQEEQLHQQQQSIINKLTSEGETTKAVISSLKQEVARLKRLLVSQARRGGNQGGGDSGDGSTFSSGETNACPNGDLNSSIKPSFSLEEALSDAMDFSDNLNTITDDDLIELTNDYRLRPVSARQMLRIVSRGVIRSHSICSDVSSFEVVDAKDAGPCLPSSVDSITLVLPECGTCHLPFGATRLSHPCGDCGRLFCYVCLSFSVSYDGTSSHAGRSMGLCGSCRQHFNASDHEMLQRPHSPQNCAAHPSAPISLPDSIEPTRTVESSLLTKAEPPLPNNGQHSVFGQYSIEVALSWEGNDVLLGGFRSDQQLHRQILFYDGFPTAVGRRVSN
ncbi:unnamed protein product [Dibothriocephalus latus]|uniref:Uncharacterized protein n=1 Tax=Dibothriocephalus latus TaxID=60516 RepID=A0A3P6SSJ4_DIBLA|nr:unnamed protein product [Dibothriocephalus latus]